MSHTEALRRIQDAYESHATVLDLSGCYIDELPAEMQHLTWLEELWCDSSEEWKAEGYSSHQGLIKQLPLWINTLKTLTRVSLRGQQLQTLPSELFTLTRLTSLDISFNQVAILPPEIAAPTRLTSLDISYNSLTTLPPELFTLIRLTSLDISFNQVAILPPEIAAFTRLTSLDISGNSLTTLPPELFTLTQLTSLDISYNSLTTLPPELFTLTQLTSLDISRIRLTSLPPDIALLKQLINLNISRNQLRTLPPELFTLTQLTSLDMSFNPLPTLTPEIGMLSQLTEFYIIGNLFTMLPAEIGKLTQLTNLNISLNRLTTLPSELFTLTQLTSLNIGSNKITTLPSELFTLTQLANLDIHGNQFTVLPPELFTFSQLSSLNISSNQFTTLPPELFTLTQLTSLNISGNQFTTLPPEIGTLTQLTSLDIGSNKITALPPELFTLTQLTSLNISDNQFTTLLSEIGTLTQLTSLDISDNQLTTLPSSIAALAELTSLDISGNQLTTLLPEIGALTKLTTLTARHNQLETLPSDMVTLTWLSDLALQGNLFTNLPSVLWTFTHLQFLDLSNNRLLFLPPEISSIDSLFNLNLSNNHLTALPYELVSLSRLVTLVLDKNPLAIPVELLPVYREDIHSYFFAYLRQCSQAGTHPLNEAKLILVGQGNVGKTSLVQRLIADSFDSHEAKTEGIAIDQWQVKLDDQEVQVNIWDFGGQEIMHATHQFFLTKRSIYLLVLHCREDDHANRLDYWLKIIQSFAPDAPIIVIGNQADQHPFDVDQRSLMVKYPQIQAFVTTSCATGAGIDLLKSAITTQLSTLRHVRDVLPAAWWRVKDQLEKWKGREYMSHDQFQTICEQEGVDDEHMQHILLGVLNDLGIALSYHDDPRLADTKVLNPTWVTQGVYTILNHPPLITKRSGIVTKQDLPAILGIHGRRYPAQKCLFIMDMMEKFELCFPLDRDCWLIPDLLPKEAPDTGNWTDALHFVYQYPVLPSSIIARFMVRSQHAIVGNLRWRTGVVLESDEAHARITADVDAAQIDIRITGEAASRRRLLSAIRYTFEPIHASLSGLRDEIQERVPLPGYPDRFVDYQELLGLEVMGKDNYVDGKLRKEFPLTQLLDGYESGKERQARQVDDYKDASVEHLEALRTITQERLQVLQQQQAKFGEIYVPPHIAIEIKALSEQLAHLRTILEQQQRSRG